jgi:signal transduction histidine kinase
MTQPRATLRLAARVAGAVAALSLAGMALQYRLVAAELRNGTVAALAADLDGLGALYDQRRIIALRQAIEYRAASDATGARFLLLARDGSVLAGNLDAWPAGVAAAGEGFTAAAAQTFEAGGATYLGVARDLPGGFPLLVARPLAAETATLAALRRGIAALALAMLAAAALVGWIAARGVMARIAAVNRLADRVAAGDLDARLPGPRSADEFGLLETHVHAMLDRIGALNRATHRLSDTIAHELRTPLGRILTGLEGIPGTEGLRADLRGTIRMFDALLDISRAEADAGAGGLLPVNLSALAGEVWELYEPAAEDRGLIPEAAIAPGLWTLGDRVLIGQALANLLDNAIKFCRPGDALRLSLAGEGGRAVLTVADTGPGLSADLRAGGIARFRRGGAAAPGHGLGLALVQAIAARHGARVEMPAVERGFTLRIAWARLPADAVPGEGG